jgi:hypothetical protein
VQEGDAIGFILDCDAGTLTFTVDGAHGNNATFNGLPIGRELFPVVSFGGDDVAGCSVRLEYAPPPQPGAIQGAAVPSGTAAPGSGAGPSGVSPFGGAGLSAGGGGGGRTLLEKSEIFRHELGVRGNVKEVIDQAAVQFGVQAEGKTLVEIADRCLVMMGSK